MVTVYRLTLDDGQDVKRTRFRSDRDLEVLHQKILSEFPGEQWPPLSPSALEGKVDQEAVNQRRHEVDQFLQTVLASELAKRSAAFKEFLGIDVPAIEGAEAEQRAVSLDDFVLLQTEPRIEATAEILLIQHKQSGEYFHLQVTQRKQGDAPLPTEWKANKAKNPFLLGVRWAFQTAEKNFFVLDRAVGQLVFYHLKDKSRLPIDLVQLYVAEASLALEYLHSQGLVFERLLPETIVAHPNGHIGLLSNEVEYPVPQEKTTSDYTAPEVLANELGPGDSRASIDWWALGTLTYELSVGIPPFYSKNEDEMNAKIQFAPIRFTPAQDSTAKSFISQLLSKDKTQRLGAEGVKSHPFLAHLDWKQLSGPDCLSHRPKKPDYGAREIPEVPLPEPIPVSLLYGSHLALTVEVDPGYSGFTLLGP